MDVCKYEQIVILMIFIGAIVHSRIHAFKEVPVPTLVIFGNTVQLNCSYYDEPLFVAWYKGENKQGISLGRIVTYQDDRYEIVGEEQEFHLKIHNATVDQQDIYECGDFADLSSRASARIYVIENGTTCSVDKGMTVIAGEHTVFTCSMDLSSDAPGDLVWYKNGIQVSRETSMTNIWNTTFTRADTDCYIDCQLEHYTLPSNQWSLVSCDLQITMDVQYAPQVETSAESITPLVEGETFSSDCRIVDYGNPPELERIYWTNPFDYIIANSSNITINNIDRSESGQYKCVMSNLYYNGEEGNGTANVQLDVQYSPDVTIMDASNTTVIEGRDYVAICNVSANPDTFGIWVNYGGGVDVNGEVLRIIRATKNHKRAYTCEAENTLYTGDEGYGNATIHLNVQYKPIVKIQDESKGMAIRGRRYIANCTVDSNPESAIEWLDPTGITRIRQSQLVIEEVRVQDEGMYLCDASNTFHNGEIGDGVDYIQLTVQYEPDVVLDIVGYTDGRGKVKEGASISIQCIVLEAEPAVDGLSWLNMGAWNEWLNFTQIDRQKTALYTCEVVNTFWNNERGKGEASIFIDVQYDPTVTVSDRSDWYAVEGRPYITRCNVTANPGPVVHWEYAGNIVSRSETLAIDSVRREHTGIYTCKARNVFWDNSIGSHTDWIFFDVQYPPVVNLTSPQTRKEGDTVQLECSVADANPDNSAIMWYKDGMAIHGSGIYEMADITRDLVGEYNCTATNIFYDGSMGTGSNVTTLYIQYKPDLQIVDNQNGEVIEGGHYSVLCISNANPTANVIWQSQNGSIVSTTSELVIDAVSRDQIGTYRCHAENNFYDGTKGLANAFIYLDIQFPPVISILSQIFCKEGDDVSLICEITASNPEYASVEWLHNGVQLDNSSDHTLFNVTRRDSGEYICRANNTYFDGTQGISSRTAIVDVQYPPVVRVKDHTRIVEGRDTMLICTIVANPRPHYVKWKKEAMFISNDTIFMIRSVSRTHTGNYTCVAVNELHDNTIATDQATMELIVEYPPIVNISGPEKPLLLGETLNITCIAVGGYPAPYLLALYYSGDDGTTVMVDESPFTVLGYLVKTIRSLAGSYYCVSYVQYFDSSTADVRSDTISVTVHFSPIITGDNVQALEEKDANLICKIDAIPSIRYIKWKNNFGVEITDIDIKNDYDGSTVTSSLHLTKVTEKKTGTYTCEATNAIGTTRHTIELSIIGTGTSFFENKWALPSIIGGGVLLIVLLLILVICLFQRRKSPPKVPPKEPHEDGHLIEDLHSPGTTGIVNHGNVNDDAYTETTLSTFKPANGENRIPDYCQSGSK
ncbi:hemicentin-2-like [Saccoglossus kowalevskii]|uniref:Hemicentin-2-like n=1 Tax=Saccoglossus kowalevskii TaxID=10224 RepID=A0ABM0GKB9_SACKO|nr:PREDICTED: hemicentin-2-like [Saccoglossus kowalevskii]